MQVHAARPTTSFSSAPTSSHHHSQHGCNTYAYPTAALVVDHAILRKRIAQSFFSSRPTKMLNQNSSQSSNINIPPKQRPLVEQDFEVIGLSDGPASAGANVRLPPGAVRRGLHPINTRVRPTTTTNGTQNGSAGSAGSGRELLSGKTRPTLPATQSSPATLTPTDHLSIPNRSSRRKKSPTRVRDPTSRHSSPSPSSPRSVSMTASSSRESLGLPSGKYRAGPRRSSWQPGRKSKSVEEIEKECDEDDDDEIPENLVFWNIPLSPRAGKTMASAGSTSPSPERLSPISNRSSDEIQSAGGMTPTASQSTISLPSLTRSDSGGSESRGRQQSRGKSWGDVMQELGDDAKDLTEALERYADESIEAQEKALQKKVAETRNLSTTPPKPTRIALPPKQVSDSLMDPLPMSKEKEAALSRTRPGWLPPKAKHEEEKHLREYQEMMRLSLESDRRRAEKEKQEAANRERLRESIHRIWDEKVIPNWNNAVLEPSTRELWWKGISPKSRGVVWERAIGNPLKISEETYTIALERAMKREEELAATKERSPEKDQFADIRRDAEKAFPELKLFQSGQPLNQYLINILMAYSVYRKDIGYSFGLHLVAANLVLNLSAPQAFQTLANLLNRSLPLSFYIQDEPQITNIYNAFLRAFQYKLPSLYQHIHVKLQLPPPLYLEAMFTTLFAMHVPVDIVTRLWDVYAFEGDAFLIRTAIAVLTVLEGRLYGSKEEVINLLGWQGSGCTKKSEWRLGKEDEFMEKVRSAGKVEVDEQKV